MKFSVSREELLKPLQLVSGVVERRQTLPILGNVLIVLEGNKLSLTATDLEVEIVARITTEQMGESGEITVPARKFADICRALPEGADIKVTEEQDKLTVRSGSSRFTLSTMPGSEFPNVDESQGQLTFSCSQPVLKRLIDATAFAMAQQDVRYYLNGMLWETSQNQLRTVATDGHRLAMCTQTVDIVSDQKTQVVLPRKGVLELSRLLDDDENARATLSVGDKHLQVITDKYTFTTKLVDGKFPDYEKVVPRGGQYVLLGERIAMKQAFGRVAILSNEKYRGVRATLSDNNLSLMANNPEQDEAEEHLPVEYHGADLELGFNINYLLDIANVLDSEKIKITLVDANTGILVEETDRDDCAYVIMPMRL
jgi:DNA polymerase-3 subunit beta